MLDTDTGGGEARLQHEARRARLGMPVAPRPHVRLDLIGRRKQRRDMPAAEAQEALPARPSMMIIMQPLYRFGWPVYVAPAFYDHCDGIPLRVPPPTWRMIARQVCQKRGISMEELLSPRRSTYIVQARHEAFWRCSKETSMSLPQIGHRFGGKDHTTVLHGIRMHERRMREAAAR